MNNKISKFLIIGMILTSYYTFSQSSQKIGNYLGEGILVDSNSTIMIPTLYNSEFFSTNKISLFGNYYSNVLFYDFKKDSTYKLLDKNSYIVGFNHLNGFYGRELENKNVTTKHILYLVKNSDHNKSGRIDSEDPSILYVSDKYGKNFQMLSSENESVVDIQLFEKQNFALIKFQLDADNDGDFEYEDKKYYYQKLDFTTLKLGSKITL